MDPDKPWKLVALPATFERVRSMLSSEERQYLVWLASEKYQGWGAIVELGVWLGSSSIALAEGLRRQGSGASIHSLDLFRWEPYMSAAAPEADLKAGDDFLPLFLQETRDYSRSIRAQKADILNYSWKDGPIEILFVDSAKTWNLTNALLREFGPHLVPGRSRIVLQDFRYHYAHCLPLIFDSRPDVWKQVEASDCSHTVTFMPLKPLYGPSGIDTDYTEESFPWESAEHLLRSRIDREEGISRYRLKATLYRKQLIDGPIAEARKLRQEILAGGLGEDDLVVAEDVETILHTRGWKAFQQGDFETARDCAERCLSIPKRSVHVLALMGNALLRLGDRQGAEQCAGEILSLAPDYAPGKQLRAQLAAGNGRYEEAGTPGLGTLKNRMEGETAIQWARNLVATQLRRVGGAGVRKL